jgi:hypothetical protein
LAFWFAALNSFRDDERPQDALVIDPDRVIAAAKDEMAGVQTWLKLCRVLCRRLDRSTPS